MARFLLPVSRAALLPAFVLLCLIARAQTPMMTEAASATNAPAGKPAPAPATPPATNAPVAAATPPPLDDYYVRYGKILSPNNQPLYPFKLNMPFPGVGEVKVPTPEEMNIRAKLEALSTLSDAEIRDQLDKWPAFGEMSLTDEGAMLARIQQFRDYRRKKAIDEAHKLGLLTLNPAQQAKFEKEYWDKKLQTDRQLSQQLQGAYKNAEQKLNEDLYREFSSPGHLAQAPPKPNPPPAPPKPNPAPANAPVTASAAPKPPTGPALAH
jgi:hypothetical protein